MTLKPFFSFYGGKWRAAPKYPAPQHDRIIEPFAGSAGYSVRYHERNIVLYDKDPVIAGLWDYLIHVSSKEIMSLPSELRHIDDLRCCQEAKWLIGFWLNKGSSAPSKQPSAWMRSGIRPSSYWGEVIKERIAGQVDKIRHWKVYNTSFEYIPDQPATWFVDPPYQKAGLRYKHGSKSVDFDALSQWCRSRSGQIIVCENDGADWLPFTHFADIKSNPGSRGKGKSKEAICLISNERSYCRE